MGKTNEEGLSKLLLSLYRAARELPLDEFQGAALDLIQPCLKFDSCRWGESSFVPNALDTHHVHLYREPPDIVGAYEAVKDQDSIVFGIFKRGGGTFRYNTAIEYQGHDKLGIREYARRFRHANTIISAAFSADACLWRWAALYRKQSDHQYTEEERRRGASLFPHLLEALTLNRMAHLEHLYAGSARRRYRLAIADTRGVLYESEPRFVDLLSRETADAQHCKLPEAMFRELQTQEAFIGRQIVVSATIHADLVFLRARPRVTADSLSPREIQVARQVVQGSSFKEIARILKLAPGTARNHIQAIHEKLQVSNKAGVIAQLQLLE